MDGVHDMGGVEGYGEIQREVHEPAFHERWEAGVFAMVRQAFFAGIYKNSDQFRHSIERIDSNAYLQHCYYGHWLGGLENALVEAGVLTQAEIDASALQLGAEATDLVAARPSAHPDEFPVQATAEGSFRPDDTKPRFGVDDIVRTYRDPVAAHTRLPAYARNKRGRIVSCHNKWVYPDTNAHGQGELPQHLYTVAFNGLELWGEEAEAHVMIHLDLFEAYLSPVVEDE